MSDIWVLSSILVLIVYASTLAVLIHNVCRYLCPMRISKPLIILFYVFTAIKLLAMVLLSYPSIDWYISKPYAFLYLINYFAENMVGTILLMQWLHLAYSIQLLYNEITKRQRTCRKAVAFTLLTIWSFFVSVLNSIKVYEVATLLIWVVINITCALFLRQKLKLLD